MCGILGQVAQAQRVVDRDRLLAANELMRARGPDGAGHIVDGNVGLAMRRLAVIDLEGGKQPLFARGGEVVAFQNGEIYNHRELRSELRGRGVPFATSSDTEVLAQGYDTWGIEGLLARVDGMFALAILDRRSKELWLARDRFGEKPLFCTSDAGGFHFASSLDALQALAARPFEVDRRRLDDYLALHFIRGRETLFRDVWRVLPGEFVRVDVTSGALTKTRYWRLPAPPPRETANEELLARLDAAVRSRLVADVPVGVFLSGGLDSSLVAALAARAKQGIDTFSMGFGASEHDESRFAELVARHVGSTHHHFQFDATCFSTLLPQVARALDEPIGDPAQLPLHWLCREARKTATVVLSGEGADELFGGYDYYAPAAPARGLSERFAKWRSSRREGETSESGYPLVFTQAERRELLPGSDESESDDSDDAAALRRETLAAARDPLQRRSLADLMTWLPDDLLVKLDRMAMAHSLEGRAPYLEPKLAELALALPPERRATVTRRKVALAEAAQALLPREIVTRRKHGFVLPMREWLRDWFAAFGGVAGWMEARPLPWLEPKTLARTVAAALERERGRPRALFALVLLAEWWAARAARATRQDESAAR